MKRPFSAGVLGFLLCAVLGSVADAGDIDSATWEPGTGSDVTLQTANPVLIDSLVSGGTVALVGSYSTPVADVTVAYGIDLGSTGWFEQGTKRYFLVPEEFVQVEADGSGGTLVTAAIPLVYGPHLVDEWSETQSLHVYMGRTGIMQVTDTSVTNEDDSKVYGVISAEPTRSLIPPPSSLLGGIGTAQTIHITLYRPTTQTTDEDYTLTFSGDAGLLDAMDLPALVTIPAGKTTADIRIEFNPRWSRHWSDTPQSLTLNAVSPLGSISTGVLFSGTASTRIGAADMIAGWFWEDEEEDCIRNAAVVPAATPRTRAGTCNPNWKIATECPVNENTHYLTYYPYECGDVGTCDEIQRSVTTESRTYTCEMRSCKIRIKLFVFSGTQCVCQSSPSGEVHTFAIPDCQ